MCGQNHDEVMTTPIENIVAAKELLENNQSPVALETTLKLMMKALVQQEKATTSRRPNLMLRYADCNNPNFWEIEMNGFIKIPNFWRQQKLLF
jgi:hypothetical protein